VDWTWIGEGNPTTPDAGDDALALSLAMELPLQRGRIAGARREALAARQGAKARRTAAGWRLRAQLEAAAAAHEDAGDRHRLFEERLLPAANQTFETTLSAYQSGQAGFQDMLDAAQVVLDLRLATVRAEADAARAYAELLGLLPEMPRTEDFDR
jgi:cobalt-zinc-cadmium efflux system outer membrane protein